MAMGYQQIIADIDAYMRSHLGPNKSWYVGIASDPRKRLFNDHAVNESSHAWIFRQALSEAVARQVEAAYLAAGCDGGPGGGDSSTTFVYAYRKAPGTNP